MKTRLSLRLRSRIIFSLIVLMSLVSMPPGMLYAKYEEAEVKFGHLGIEEGLSHASVFAILQDRDGFMWFGTQDGLHKFNGYDFTVYKHEPNDPNSIGTSWITVLHQDAEGIIWVGTEQGLSRFNRNRDIFIHYLMYPDPDDPADNSVQGITDTNDGKLWVGTRNGQIHQFDKEQERFTATFNVPDVEKSDYNSIHSILIDRTSPNIYWIGSNRGINKFDLTTRTFTTYPPYPNENLEDPDKQRLYALFYDSSGRIWGGGGSQSGLHVFDPQTETFITSYTHDPDDPQSLSSNEIGVITEDDSGQLWVGSTDSGLNLFHPETDSFTHYQEDSGDPDSLSSNDLLVIYEDNAGTLWIGTHNLGIDILDKQLTQFHHYKHHPNRPDSLSPNPVRAIHAGDPGTIWIGTEGSGLNKFDRERQNFIHYRHDPNDPNSLSDDFVTALWEDRTGLLWIGTWNSGLDVFDPSNGTFIQHYSRDKSDPRSLSGDGVQAILEDRNGTIWVGSKGLGKFNPDTQDFTNYVYDENEPGGIGGKYMQTNAFLEDAEGNIWMGMWVGGVNKFDPRTETFTYYQHDPADPSTISDNRVISLCQDQTGMIWAGTPGSGLNRLNPLSGTAKRYTREHGLPNNFIYGIVEDHEGDIWVSTARGLSKMDPAKETFTNYRTSDGLQSDQFFWGAAAKTADGELLFGGINGFNIFRPEDITKNDRIPPVYLTALKQGGEPLPGQRVPEKLSEITLSWRHNFFEFEISALNYTKTEKNQYKYFLEGVDEDWYHAGTKRYGRYAGLPDGSYTFHVTGSNNDGVWNKEGLAVNVKVLPPFWRTWWFKNLIVAVFMGAAAGGFFVFDRRQEMKMKLMQAEYQANILGKEMELARQIQTAILPKNVSHDELDIEATMLPAEEVGGDYYDVLYGQDGALWLGIGDVSGHGVTPGLIMMMAQTVHTTITTQLDVTPQDVVNIVNKVLFQNVNQRLGEDHFMTFSTLKYMGNGDFIHAGAHLDLVVYRRQTQECELFDTPGTWLNLLPDISHATENTSFHIEVGDILVLYTDGLTEAENARHELFDMKRLVASVTKHADKRPAAMRDAIMQDVLDWCEEYRDDDMTLLIVRRMT